MEVYGRNMDWSGSHMDPPAEWAPAGPETGLEGRLFMLAFEFQLNFCVCKHIVNF